MPYTFNPLSGNFDYYESSTSSGNVWVFDRTPTPATDGVTTVFTTPDTYVAGSLQVYLNGQTLTRVNDFSETTSTSFTMVQAPLSGDTLRIGYRTS